MIKERALLFLLLVVLFLPSVSFAYGPQCPSVDAVAYVNTNYSNPMVVDWAYVPETWRCTAYIFVNGYRYTWLYTIDPAAYIAPSYLPSSAPASAPAAAPGQGAPLTVGVDSESCVAAGSCNNIDVVQAQLVTQDVLIYGVACFLFFFGFQVGMSFMLGSISRQGIRE